MERKELVSERGIVAKEMKSVERQVSVKSAHLLQKRATHIKPSLAIAPFK